MKTGQIKCSDEYYKLVRAFPLVLLRTKAQYHLAQKTVRAIVKDPLNLTPAQIDYIGALGALITAYEKEHLPPAPKIPGREILRFFMQQHEMTLSALAKEIGGHRSNLSAFISGRRALSKNVAMSLAKRFHVSVDLFLEG